MADGTYRTTEPSIDVVIPVRGRWELTASCLAHLDAQTVAHSVIVVDNGSTDGTLTRLRDEFPQVRVIALGTNAGFSAACNRGAAAGSGEVIVLLNNDVDAQPDYLERLVRPFADDARTGSAASLLVRPGGQIIDCIGLTVDRTLAGFPRLRGEPVRQATSDSPLLVGPSAGGGAYRRAAWEQVGGLDEGVMFYGEDVDLALRIRASGWETAAVPEAVAVHLGSASAAHRSSWQRFQGGFSRGYFLRRYRVLESRAALRAAATECIVVVGDAVLSRDLCALRGRIAGWSAAADLGRSPKPPPGAVDATIGFVESLRLRRIAYAA